MTNKSVFVLSVVTFLFISAAANAAPSVTISSSPPSPVNVGTLVTWIADSSDDAAGTLLYRFRVRRPNLQFRTVRDFGPLNRLDWTASASEGFYEIEVTIQNRQTGETAATSSLYQFISAVNSSDPVVSPTSHPLVYLFSAPPCRAGNRMRVEFQADGGPVQSTPQSFCSAGRSMNFYLAGLRPTTHYTANSVIDNGFRNFSSHPVTFTTGAVSANLIPMDVLQFPGGPGNQDVLLQSPINAAPVATDLVGNLLWYGPSDVYYVTRPLPGGTFLGLVPGPELQFEAVREFDLTGMTVRETNVARINEQLAALGKRQVGWLHHEARRIDGGRTVILATVEQILTDVQGPGPVDVIGDMIIVLDSDMQVEWTWDTFDHLDVTRKATLNETCKKDGTCVPYFLAEDANDWIHGNSVDETPDGSLLFSSRHQDWLIKINYRNGRGDGRVLWKLGKDGDFSYNSGDPYPWFSHQHDGSVLANNHTYLVFDNGNLRQAADPNAKSRGQVLHLDEKDRLATLDMNVDLGFFSVALGSAQKLRDGTYNFEMGLILGPHGFADVTAIAMQVDDTATSIYAMKSHGLVYRSFRMRSLYQE